MPLPVQSVPVQPVEVPSPVPALQSPLHGAQPQVQDTSLAAVPAESGIQQQIAGPEGFRVPTGLRANVGPSVAPEQTLPQTNTGDAFPAVYAEQAPSGTTVDSRLAPPEIGASSRETTGKGQPQTKSEVSVASSPAPSAEVAASPVPVIESSSVQADPSATPQQAEAGKGLPATPSSSSDSVRVSAPKAGEVLTSAAGNRTASDVAPESLSSSQPALRETAQAQDAAAAPQPSAGPQASHKIAEALAAQTGGATAAKAAAELKVQAPNASSAASIPDAHAKGSMAVPGQSGHSTSDSSGHRSDSGASSGNPSSNQQAANPLPAAASAAVRPINSAVVPFQVHPQTQSASSASASAGNSAASSAAGHPGIAQPLPASVQIQETIHTAQLIQSVNGSEMRVGIHTAEFGKISISTSASRNALSAQIALDHTELAKVIADNIPQIHEALGPNQHVEIRVATTGQPGSGLDSHSGGSNGNSQQAWRSGATRAGPAPVSSHASSSMTAEPRAWAVETSNSSRLDVRI